MITLNLTNTQADEILHALRTSYADYNEKLGAYYNESIASFTTGELYDHKDANGFINLFGLPMKIRGMKGLTKV